MTRSVMMSVLAIVMKTVDGAPGIIQPRRNQQVAVSDLRAAGLAASELGQLIGNGYFALRGTGRENGRAKTGRAKSGQPTAARKIPATARLIVTPPGKALAYQIEYPLSKGWKARNFRPDFSLPAAPTWNAELGELHWGRHLVERFNRPAPNLVALLNVLQRRDWEPWHPNPFRSTSKRTASYLLHEAIRSFNSSPMGKFIKLHGDGSGTGFRWERLI